MMRIFRLYKDLKYKKDKLLLTNLDYKQLKIPLNSVVYCDPPYRGTTYKYKIKFNYEEFYEWISSIDAPVFVSEYSLPLNNFFCVFQKKNCSWSRNKIRKTICESNCL